MKYLDLLKANKLLKSELQTPIYSINIVANITVNQIKEVFEYGLRKQGINAEVNVANYDNILQESQHCSAYQLVCVFWELCNISDGFHYKVEQLNSAEFEELIEKTQMELAFLMKNLHAVPLVLFNEFSGKHFSNSALKKSRLETLADILNSYIKQFKPQNWQLVQLGSLISKTETDVHWPYYYQNKSLYTLEFFYEYCRRVMPAVLSVTGRSKKIIVFDCDNTLWKGVVGEEGIEMSARTSQGGIFAEIQSMALQLNKAGVLLGLCSKNNPQDVEQILNHHEDMQVKNRHICLKKINWSDKASNLRAMAAELNIGLDSFVFVDDSPFEINLVKSQLPEITTVLVPENIYHYPAVIREILPLFYQFSQTDEDSNKTQMYQQQLLRSSKKSEFKTLEQYLASLALCIDISINETSSVARVAQLTQKTNQFNLTTKRYTENEITQYMSDKSVMVVSVTVKDTYGDSGLTAVVIVKCDQARQSAMIDSFLLSCRIIGRNIEHVLLDYIVEKLKKRGVKSIQAQYCKTAKNKQVSQFYSKRGFKELDEPAELTEKLKVYRISSENYKASTINYIQINET